MSVLIIVALGTIYALSVGLRLLTRFEALAAFFLYQAALGMADLVTLGLRAQRGKSVTSLLWPLAWLASLPYALYGQAWAGVPLALVAVTVLSLLHRPDMMLFGALAVLVSAALLLGSLLRGSFNYGYLMVLLAMAALTWWRLHGGRAGGDATVADGARTEAGLAPDQTYAAGDSPGREGEPESHTGR